jgi:integrase
MALFRYKAGRPGFNLVTVFRRYEGGPIYIETWPNGKRRRETLRNKLGVPLFDEKRAMHIADLVASKIEHAAHGEMDKLLGIPSKRTLKELLDTYHEKRGHRWDTNKRHQELARDFWISRIGANTDIRRVAGMASEIEAWAAQEGVIRGWSPRTEGKYLKYLRTAFNFGRNKLKWFGEEYTLSALEIPPPDSISKPYSQDEAARIMGVAHNVDLRAAAAARVAYLGLRRIGAIRHLKVVDVERGAGEMVLNFGRERDKTKRTGEVVITDAETVALVERLMRTPAVRATGLLFPEGELTDRTTKDRRPLAYERFNEMLRDVEKLAKVKHVHGRGYHGFKRLAATDAANAGQLSAAATQANTNEATLRNVYVQHDREPKRELGKTLAKKMTRN